MLSLKYWEHLIIKCEQVLVSSSNSWISQGTLKTGFHTTLLVGFIQFNKFKAISGSVESKGALINDVIQNKG